MSLRNDDPWRDENQKVGGGNNDDNDDGDNQDEEDEMKGSSASHIMVLLHAPSLAASVLAKGDEDEDGDEDDGENTDNMVDVDEKCASQNNENQTRSKKERFISGLDGALLACEQLARQMVQKVVLLKTGKRDGLGILLWDVVPASNDDDDDDDEEEDVGRSRRPIVTTLLKLQPPNVAQVRLIRQTLDLPIVGRERDLNREFDFSYYSTGQRHVPFASMHQALIQAQKAFSDASCVNEKYTKAKLPDEKTIIVMTAATLLAATTHHYYTNTNHNKARSNDNGFTQEETQHLASFTQQMTQPYPLTQTETEQSQHQRRPTPVSDPPQDEHQQQRLVRAAQDVKENNTDLRIWSINETAADPEEDASTFSLSGLVDKDSYQTCESLDELLRDIETEQTKMPRRSFCIPMLLPQVDKRSMEDYDSDDDFLSERTNNDEKEEDLFARAMLVDCYKVIQKRTKPSYSWVTQCTKEKADVVRQQMVKITGEVLDQPTANKKKRNDRIVQFAELGSDPVFMYPDDAQRIRMANNNQANLPKPDKSKKTSKTGGGCLWVRGFKPANFVPLFRVLDTGGGLLAYPNDEDAPGSLEAFAYLHAAMLKKNVWAIGEFVARRTAATRLVALVPQTEKKYEENDREKVLLPPGMLILSLPFEDDCRTMRTKRFVKEESHNDDSDNDDNDDNEIVSSSLPQSILNASAMMKKMELTDDVQVGVNFENATINRFWEHIESIALGCKLQPEEACDIELDEPQVLATAGPEIRAFADSLPLDRDPKKDTKRARGRTTTKRKREDKPLPKDDSGCDWDDLLRNDEIGGCTVSQLKSYLRSVGARLGGRKSELVLRVKEDLIKRIAEKQSFED